MNRDLVTLVVTTRNRFEDLNLTLRILLSQGYGASHFILINDFSDEPWVDFEILERFKNLTRIDNPERRGLIANRNAAMRICRTPYVLNLDDDSCFLAPVDLDALAHYMNCSANVAALEFTNYEKRLDGASACEEHVSGDRPVKMFTGCGNLIRVSAALSVGGYDEAFFQMCEERDLCQRFARRGWIVQWMTDVEVVHRKTPSQRHRPSLVYFSVRNTLVASRRADPAAIFLIKLISMLGYQLAWHKFQPIYILPIVRGFLAGTWRAITLHSDRPMTWSQFRKLRSLRVSGLTQVDPSRYTRLLDMQSGSLGQVEKVSQR